MRPKTAAERAAIATNFTRRGPGERNEDLDAHSRFGRVAETQGVSVSREAAIRAASRGRRQSRAIQPPPTLTQGFPSPSEQLEMIEIQSWRAPEVLSGTRSETVKSAAARPKRGIVHRVSAVLSSVVLA